MKAIGETFGWKRITKTWWPETNDLEWVGTKDDEGNHRDKIELIPCYLTDLNACAEFEKSLIEHHGLYWFELAEVVSGFKREEFDYSNEYFLKDIACATAAQRAEAFLRTIGKWEDQP